MKTSHKFKLGSFALALLLFAALCQTALSQTAPAEVVAATVRIQNCLGGSCVLMSGVLADAERGEGLVLTAAHGFRERGKVSVHFAGGGVHGATTFDAIVVDVDPALDVACLAIARPPVAPLGLAAADPRPGTPVYALGYGRGQLAMTAGEARGYVAVLGAPQATMLEITGGARQGDSGGPMLLVESSGWRLCGVVCGTDGRVIDGCCLSRLRAFLARCRAKRGWRPGQGSGARGQPERQTPPNIAPAPPNVAPPENTEPAPQTAGPPAGPPAPPRVEMPPAAGADAIARRERDRLRAELAAARKRIAELAAAAVASPAAPTIASTILEALAPLMASGLVGLGLPAGAGALVTWLVLRLARKGTQRAAQQSPQSPLESIPAARAATIRPAAEPQPPPAEPLVVHENRFFEIENRVLDKCWADAHARLLKEHPAWELPLSELVRLKDQFLAGVLPKIRRDG